MVGDVVVGPAADKGVDEFEDPPEDGGEDGGADEEWFVGGEDGLFSEAVDDGVDDEDVACPDEWEVPVCEWLDVEEEVEFDEEDEKDAEYAVFFEHCFLWLGLSFLEDEEVFVGELFFVSYFFFDLLFFLSEEFFLVLFSR